MRDKKLGYKPEQVLGILTSGAESREQVSSLKAALEEIPEVLSVSRSQAFPGITTSGRTIPPLSGQGEGKSIKTSRSDAKVLDVLGIKLLAGAGLPNWRRQIRRRFPAKLCRWN